MKDIKNLNKFVVLSCIVVLFALIVSITSLFNAKSLHSKNLSIIENQLNNFAQKETISGGANESNAISLRNKIKTLLTEIQRNDLDKSFLYTPTIQDDVKLVLNDKSTVETPEAYDKRLENHIKVGVNFKLDGMEEYTTVTLFIPTIG